MRTTVTLDPDVADKLTRLAHAQRTSFKKTLNDVLRRGLARGDGRSDEKPFVVKPQRTGFRPGVDPLRLNQLADDLEVQAFARGRKR